MVIVAVAAVALAWLMWARRPRPFPVSGTITYNGQPVGNGKIIFMHKNQSGQQATGQIVSGRYSLTSFAPNDGAISGIYDVVIVSPSVPAKYRSQSTFGLQVTVQQGANIVNIDLR